MKGSGFIRGAAVGGIGAALVMTASSALAGTGVGGVFNLGQSNSVDQRTLLTGNTPSGGVQLQVTDSLAAGGGALGAQSTGTGPTAKFVNKSTGTAAAFNVGAGVAPFTTNSKVKVANLNADTLDGMDSTAFLPVGGKAADSDLLDGLDSSAFLPVGGKAADSNLLDGLDSSQLIQGAGKAAGAAYAVAPGGSQDFQIGPFLARFRCPSDLTTNGTILFGTVGTTGANMFVDSGGANPSYFQVASGTGFSFGTLAAGDSFTVRIQDNGEVATLEVATVNRPSSSDCHFQAQGVLTTY